MSNLYPEAPDSALILGIRRLRANGRGKVPSSDLSKAVPSGTRSGPAAPSSASEPDLLGTR